MGYGSCNAFQNLAGCKEMIEAGDYILVTGEGNQVFKVIELVYAPYEGVVLDTGWCEETKKCWKIPKKYHKKFYKDPSTYINISDIPELMEDDEDDS